MYTWPLPNALWARRVAVANAALSSLAAAARGRLENDRIADLAGDALGTRGVRDGLRAAGHDRHAGRSHAAPRLRLVAHRADRLRRGPDERQSGLSTRLGEAPVLGEEAVPGVHRLRARLAGGGDNSLDAQVRLARRRRAEQHGVIRVLHVGRVTIGLGVDGDGAQSQRAAAAEDATRDLPAVGDENGAEHAQGTAETGSVETRSPAAMRQPDAVGVQRSCTNPIARGLSIRTLTICWRPIAASPTTRVPVIRPASGARAAVSASRAAGSTHAAAPAPSPDPSAVRWASTAAARSAGRVAGSKSGGTWTRSGATTSRATPSRAASTSGAVASPVTPPAFSSVPRSRRSQSATRARPAASPASRASTMAPAAAWRRSSSRQRARMRRVGGSYTAFVPPR